MCVSKPKVEKPKPLPKPTPPPPAPIIEAPKIDIGRDEEGSVNRKKRQRNRSLRISLQGGVGQSTSSLGTGSRSGS